MISAYAIAEYPEVFGGCCLLVDRLERGGRRLCRLAQRPLAAAGSHRIYFDHGTETYDAHYGPYQLKMTTSCGTRAIEPARIGSPAGSRGPTTRREHGASACIFRWGFLLAPREP